MPTHLAVWDAKSQQWTAPDRFGFYSELLASVQMATRRQVLSEIEASRFVSAVQQIALTKWDWATLLKRVWGFDALACTGCGGRMRFIAVIKDRAVIERILKHIGEDAEEPRFARARDPCDLWA